MALKDDIQKIFKDKPVRILIAVFVISGFIALISIILSIIINNINKKKDCKTDGHIQYPDYNDICGPNCVNYGMNICPTKDVNGETIGINCIPSCPPFTTYDLNTCKCVPDCTIHGDQWHNEPKHVFDGKEFKWSCRQNCNVDGLTCGMGTWCNTNNEKAMCTYSLNKPDYCPSNSFKTCSYGEECINDECQLSICGDDEVIWADEDNKCDNLTEKVYKKNKKDIPEDEWYETQTYEELYKKNNILTKICVKRKQDGTYQKTGLRGGPCVKINQFYKKYDENFPKIGTCNVRKFGVNNNIQCPNIKHRNIGCISDETEFCENGWQIKHIDQTTGNSNCISVDNQDIKNAFNTGTENDDEVNDIIKRTGKCCAQNKLDNRGVCCPGILYNDSTSGENLCLNSPDLDEISNTILDYEHYYELFNAANIPLDINGNPPSVIKDEYITQLNTALSETNILKYNDIKNGHINTKDIQFVKFNGKIHLGCGSYPNNNFLIASVPVPSATSSNSNMKKYICVNNVSSKLNIIDAYWDPKEYEYTTPDNTVKIKGKTCYRDDIPEHDPDNRFWYNDSSEQQYYGYWNALYKYNPSEFQISPDDPYTCVNLFKKRLDTDADQKSPLPSVANLIKINTEHHEDNNKFWCKFKFKCNEQTNTLNNNGNDINYALQNVPGSFNRLNPIYTTNESDNIRKHLPISYEYNDIPSDTIAQNIHINHIENIEQKQNNLPSTIRNRANVYNLKKLYKKAGVCNYNNNIYTPINYDDEDILLTNGKIVGRAEKTFDGKNICKNIKYDHDKAKENHCFYDGNESNSQDTKIHTGNYGNFKIDVNNKILIK